MVSPRPNQDIYRRQHRSAEQIAHRAALLGPVRILKRLPGNVTKALAYPRPDAQSRADHLRRLEREVVGLPIEPETKTPFEIFGARATAGEMRATESADGRKLGSAYGAAAGSARLNKALTAGAHKEKMKHGWRIETELRAQMREDMIAVRKKSRQLAVAMVPNTSPEILHARRGEAERVYRLAKPRKKRSGSPSHRGPRWTGWDHKLRPPTKKTLQERTRKQRSKPLRRKKSR